MKTFDEVCMMAQDTNDLRERLDACLNAIKENFADKEFRCMDVAKVLFADDPWWNRSPSRLNQIFRLLREMGLLERTYHDEPFTFKDKAFVQFADEKLPPARIQVDGVWYVIEDDLLLRTKNDTTGHWVEFDKTVINHVAYFTLVK